MKIYYNNTIVSNHQSKGIAKTKGMHTKTLKQSISLEKRAKKV